MQKTRELLFRSPTVKPAEERAEEQELLRRRIEALDEIEEERNRAPKPRMPWFRNPRMKNGGGLYP